MLNVVNEVASPATIPLLVAHLSHLCSSEKKRISLFVIFFMLDSFFRKFLPLGRCIPLYQARDRLPAGVLFAVFLSAIPNPIWSRSIGSAMFPKMHDWTLVSKHQRNCSKFSPSCCCMTCSVRMSHSCVECNRLRTFVPLSCTTPCLLRREVRNVM